jgi:hypothetical protein
MLFLVRGHIGLSEPDSNFRKKEGRAKPLPSFKPQPSKHNQLFHYINLVHFISGQSLIEETQLIHHA